MAPLLLPLLGSPPSHRVAATTSPLPLSSLRECPLPLLLLVSSYLVVDLVFC